VWPQRSSAAFAAEYAQIIAVLLHPGAFWSDPQVQERRRAELANEQERNASYHGPSGTGRGATTEQRAERTILGAATSLQRP
jgi:hypothetical protein